MRILPQDMGCALYQGSHAEFRVEIAEAPVRAGFPRAARLVRARELFPLRLPTKVDLHVRGITTHSRSGTQKVQ